MKVVGESVDQTREGMVGWLRLNDKPELGS